MFVEFRSFEFKDRLTYVQTMLDYDSPALRDGSLQLSNESIRARPIMSYFNNVGLLVYHGTITEEAASSIMGGSVVSAWKALAPYVYAERRRRGDDPNYYGYFEHLAASIVEIGPDKLDAKLELKKLPPARSA